MSDKPTWYDLLGVHRAASDEKIRTAWKSAIDGLEPGDRRFPSLNKAAEVLLDPARRAAYDAELGDEEGLDEPDDGFEKGAGTPTSTDGPAGSAVVEQRSAVVPSWLLVALAVSVAIVGGAALYLGLGSSNADTEESAAAARTAAEQAIVPILSYDYRHLDQDRAAAQSYLTSKYKADYDKTFSLVQQNAEAVQPVVVAKLVSSGLERSGADRVKVVLFVDQETTNKQTAEPVIYQNYVTVTMQEVDGEWLVDQLDTQG